MDDSGNLTLPLMLAGLGLLLFIVGAVASAAYARRHGIASVRASRLTPPSVDGVPG